MLNRILHGFCVLQNCPLPAVFILSPLHRLPPELLYQIFDFSAPPRLHLDGPDNPIHWSELPFNVSQVCHQWRAITSLLFIKARFYTHLPATSNSKTFVWEIAVFGNIVITIDSSSSHIKPGHQHSLLSQKIATQFGFHLRTSLAKATYCTTYHHPRCITTRCPSSSLRDVGPFPLCSRNTPRK